MNWMKFNKYAKIFAIVIVLLIGSVSYADYATEAKLEYNKGVDLYQQGQFERAIEAFKSATQLDPNYIDAYYNLGALLEYLKQDEAALNAFKQIILRKPDDYESVYKAAEISNKLGDTEKARMYLTLIPQGSAYENKAMELLESIEEPKQTQPAVSTPSSPQSSYNKSEYGTNAGQEPSNLISNTNGVYENIPSPTGIVTDNNGNVYVAGFSDNTIYKIGSDNNKIVFIKDSKIDGPIGLAIDRDGNIYIANYNKDNVLKVSKYGEISEFISNISNPYCMHIKGNLLFVSSQGDNSVIRRRLH